MSDAQTVQRAFVDAQSRRPYPVDADLVAAATPPGGEWQCGKTLGETERTVKWGAREVMSVRTAADPIGEIAMAATALPTMDGALRAIIVLAEDGANASLIRRLAMAVIAHVERPAPALYEQNDEEGVDE